MCIIYNNEINSLKETHFPKDLNAPCSFVHDSLAVLHYHGAQLNTELTMPFESVPARHIWIYLEEEEVNTCINQNYPYTILNRKSYYGLAYMLAKKKASAANGVKSLTKKQRTVLDNWNSTETIA